MLLSGQFFLFLAVFLPLCFLMPQRRRGAVLLLGGIVFYAFAGWRALCIMLALTLVHWLIGRRMGALIAARDATLSAHRQDGSWDKSQRRAYHDAQGRRIRAWLALGVTLDVGVLLIFKMGLPARIGAMAWTLPLGLSFVSLSAIGYLCDVARETIACETSLVRFASFVFYFPALWQGPISRYGELAPQLSAPCGFDGERVASGLIRMLWGCVKKLIFADTAAVAVAALIQGRDAWGGVGMLLLIPLYTLQMYADFTGGMDIMLGVSEVLGIRLYENFDRPFSSLSLGEYWRRWHRSLGRFFTDYVFYPLSVSRPAQSLSRGARRLLGEVVGRRVPLYMSMLVTWTLTGLWHGISWNFVWWGWLNGLLLLLSQELRPLRARLGDRFSCVVASRPWHALLCMGTLALTALLRTLDLDARAGQTMALWRSMLTADALRTLVDPALWQSLGLRGAQWCLLTLGVVLMWWVGRGGLHPSEDGRPLRARIIARPVLCGALCAIAVAAIAVFGQYGIGYDAAKFIYGQF